MRGRNGGEQNLSKEQGPLDEGPPSPPKECAQRWRKMKEWKKNCPLYFPKIDFFPYSKRRTDWEAGWGLGSKEEGRLFQAQKQIKEVFWQNTECDGTTHVRHSHTHTRAVLQT